MATLRNKKKLAALSRETPENTRNSQSQNTLDPEMAQKYISQVAEEIEERVTKKLSFRSLQKLQKLKRIQSDGVSYFGCSVKTWWISSEPAGTDWFRGRSENIQERRLRKPGTQWGSFPKRSLSQSDGLFSSLW